MRNPQRSVLLVGAVVVAALALAGCTGQTTPRTTHRPSTTAASPTPTQSATPQSTVPLGCADLESASFVAAHYTGDTITAAVDEHSTARGFFYRSFQQGGGLHCVWGGSGRTDGGYDLGMELFVVTDAASAYATFASADRGNITWVDNRLSDHSIEFCMGDRLQCYGDVLIGSIWLDFRLTDDRTMTDAQAYAWADEQMKPALAALTHAGAERAPWKPPASAFDTSKLCDATTASAIAGRPVSITLPQPDPTGYPVSVGSARAGTARCTWTSNIAGANIDVSGLTGGAWAPPGMMANPAEAPGILGGPAQPVAIASADGAFVADGEEAWGAIVCGGSLVEIAMESSNTGSDVEPMMTQLAAYISAHS